MSSKTEVRYPSVVVAGPTSGKTTAVASSRKSGVDARDLDCVWKRIFTEFKESEFDHRKPTMDDVNKLKGLCELFIALWYHKCRPDSVLMLGLRPLYALEKLGLTEIPVVVRAGSDMAAESAKRGDFMRRDLCDAIAKQGADWFSRRGAGRELESGEHLASLLRWEVGDPDDPGKKRVHDDDAKAVVECLKEDARTLTTLADYENGLARWQDERKKEEGERMARRRVAVYSKRKGEKEWQFIMRTSLPEARKLVEAIVAKSPDADTKIDYENGTFETNI